ncbi:MAG: hypothetical protein JNL24_13510 [Bacteroidia bacterium]|nr:hypothetical protein [Bacteroidia bacterium]
MEKTKHIPSLTVKHFVFVFFIISLFFPLIQQHLKLIKEKPLEGFFNIEDYPTLAIDKWKNGEFQKQFETAYNDQIGFHDFFIELQSQINYSLFKISKIQSVVVGKNGYLYVRNYIDAVNGNDFMGSAYINLQIEKAKVVDSILKQKNITLVFAIAPGKGSFFPEYIPDAHKTNNHPDSTNYACYKKAFAKSSLNFLDLREYFLKIKDTCRYPLFSKAGVHWSEYASYIAIDTFKNYLEQIQKISLNKVTIKDYNFEFPARPSDYDAANLMNTFSIIPHYKMSYFSFKYNFAPLSKTQKLLVVGDSYYSCIKETKIPYYIFDTVEYRLYNKPEMNKRNDAEKYSTILILGTDGTLNQYPYNFIDQLYEHYSSYDQNYKNLKLKEFRMYTHKVLENIEKNKKWKNLMLKNAKKKNINPTEEFVNNAIWLYYNQ